MRKWVVKVLKVTGISLLSLLALLFILPYLFPEFVAKKIKTWANSAIVSDLSFSKARLSFFHHFPSLTLTLHDFKLNGSAPFQTDTLVAAEEVSLGIDLRSVFSSTININEIYLSKGRIEVKVSKEGVANYNVYKSTPSSKPENPADTGSASLKLENIHIENTKLTYADRSLPMLIVAKGLNYTGTGDLSKAVFDLHSKMDVDSFRLSYDGETYISNKKLNADLITKINTNSLTLLFEKNDLRINKLPVQLNGKFEFLSDGYDMDFRLVSKETDLHDVFTALPQSVLQWLDKTEVKGYTEIKASLIGPYNAGANKMPDLNFNMKIRDGYISNNKAPFPAKNIFLNLDTRLPSLNPDSLLVNIDSVYFNIDKDYVSSVIHWQGMNTPAVKAKLNADIDLEKWDRAFGIDAFDVKGRCQVQFTADGKYATGQNPKNIRPDTVVTSIPSFTLRSSMRDGYFKYASLPQGMEQISFNVNAQCPDGVYQHTNFAVNDLNAKVLSNFIKGYCRVSNAKDFPVDANLQSVLHLSDVKQFYPLDSIDLSGDLHVDINTKGKYDPIKRLFPVTTALFQLKNGAVKTRYYPRPLEKIQVDATVKSTKGTLRDLNVQVKPISFELEGQPFLVQASLQNFNDLKYDISSRGVLDIGKIYQVFAVKGYNAKGFIQTNLSLKGLQSDATAGRYEKLNNKGTMKVRDLVLTAEMLPKPFLISNGLFRFDQDKMWFDAFKAQYGKSNISLNGYLYNVFNYAVKPNEPLRGTFELNTPYLLVDEWMVFGDGQPAANAPAAGASGVVIVPANLDLTFKAAAAKVGYDGLVLQDVKGQMMISGGKIVLQQTAFRLIDAPVEMNASYASVTPYKAVFDYHVKADELNVKRAYKEVKLFRDMAPAAAKAEGIIGIDYALSGRLDANMYPVFPSLKGGGVLSVKKVKLHGFKLMNAVSKSTGRDNIKDPDLAKININTTIANNLINIQRVKLRVAGFRPRFEGQVSFDGKFNLTGRLGLPPFGIIGIPFTVVGDRNNPKVKLRRGRDSDKLEETEDPAEADYDEETGKAPETKP